MPHFETIIVGNGLIGSAAARHLSALGERIAVVGQAEPLDAATHDGVFASHYDQRRLAHVLGRAGPWVDAKRSAIAGYRDLEAQSGVPFYDPVGYLVSCPAEQADDPQSRHQTATRLNIPHSYYPAGDDSWRDLFPAYAFPDANDLLYEPDSAGAIDPRAMRRAQLTLARAQGATVIDALVTAIRRQQGEMLVHTQDGQVIRGKKVLLATGAFTNLFALLPRKLALILKTEVVIWGEVSAADAVRLGKLPTAGYAIDDPQLSDCYMTPAAQHANGRFYVKLGANSVLDRFLDEPAPSTRSGRSKLQDWFRNGDSDAFLPALQRALTSIMPRTDFLSFETKRCMLTRTATTYPMIDQVAEQLFVAVGGNGGSAQCADSWGRISAELTHTARWPSPFPRSLFRAVFK